MQELIPEFKCVEDLPIISAAMAEEVFKILDTKDKVQGGKHLQLKEGDKLLGVSREQGVFGPNSCFVGIYQVAGSLLESFSDSLTFKILHEATFSSFSLW
jgi:hypothetical protein